MSRWIELQRQRKSTVTAGARLATSGPGKTRLKPSGRVVVPPPPLVAGTDLSWCPLYQRHVAGIAMGSIDAEMLRILALPFIGLGIARCPDREAFGASLLNHATNDPDFRLNNLQIDGAYSYLTFGGVLAPLSVGSGKTWLSVLCAHLGHKQRGHERVVLLVPPEVLDQLLNRDLPQGRRLLALDGTTFTAVVGDRENRLTAAKSAYPGVYIMTYSTLSTATGYETLQAIGATLYVLDEAHRVARPTTVRTKRLMTIIREKEAATGRAVEMVAMSGTISRKSISEYAHLTKQCLRDLSPLPVHPVAIGEWSDVLDADSHSISASEQTFRYLLEWAMRNGAVIESTPQAAKTQQELLREAHAHRMHTTPGVIASTEQSVDCSLIIHWREPKMPADDTGMRIKTLMAQVVEQDLTPDGDEIDWAMHKWKWLWELSTGFYNSLIWPKPEQEVERQKRRNKTISNDEAVALIEQAKAHHKLLQAYHRELRHFLADGHIPSCDTPALVAAEIVRQVVNGKILHKLPPDLIVAYTMARDAHFDDLPERLSIPVRISDYKVLAGVEWAKEFLKTGGNIWHHHPEIGRWQCEELKKAGVPFTYAPAGDNEAPYQPGIVVTSYAHGTGKNLQHQNHNLFLEMRRESSVMEQTLGRTHRQGQKADEVHADLFISNGFDLAMFSDTLRDADYVQSSTKQVQKLVYATYDPLVPPVDPRLYVKLGLLRERPSSISVREYDQVTDDRKVAELFRAGAYKLQPQQNPTT